MTRRFNFELDADAKAVLACVEAMERSNVDARQDLRTFLKDVPESARNSALAELVRVDYERSWKLGRRQSIANYLKDYPELRTTQEMMLKLLHDEFEFRLKQGERPDVAEYQQILPSFTPPDTANDYQFAKTTPLDTTRGVPLKPPTEQIGKYKIVRELGSGGFGVVLEAYDEQLHRTVAIKVSRKKNKQPGLARGQLAEAQNCACLEHPGIVRLIDIGETIDHQGYIVYEFVPGETMEDRFQKGNYTIEEATEWVAQVAEALHYAHNRGIVHRDIKPANVLIDANNRARVIDFGLASRNSEFHADDRGRVLGTLAYTSPEQAEGKSHWASAQSDLYSLGTTLYQLLCKRLPFRAKDANDLLDQIQHRPPPPPRSLNDKIPRKLEEICLKALAKAPDARYKTGLDMAADLRAPAVEPRRNSALRWLQAAAVIAALIVGGLIIRGSTPAPSTAPQLKPMQMTSFAFKKDGKQLVASDMPLSSDTQLAINATFNQEAFTYLLEYELNSPGKLLWPRSDDADSGEKTNPFSIDRLSLPRETGAMLFILIASAEKLPAGEIAKLLEQHALAGQVDTSSESRFQIIIDPRRGSVNSSENVFRGGGQHLDRNFKSLLIGNGGEERTFYGVVVTHRDSSSDPLPPSN